MIVLFSHIRTGKWSSIMPLNLAETFGFSEPIRAIPIVEPDASHLVGVVVRNASLTRRWFRRWPLKTKGGGPGEGPGNSSLNAGQDAVTGGAIQSSSTSGWSSRSNQIGALRRCAISRTSCSISSSAMFSRCCAA